MRITSFLIKNGQMGNIGLEDFLTKLNQIKITKFVYPEKVPEPMSEILDKLDYNYEKYESDYLKEIVRCQKLIIVLTKKNDFIEAEEIVFLAKNILSKLKGEPRKLGCIFLYPSFAFYVSKKRNLKLAKRYITITIRYDDMLTDKYPVLHLHKLHHLLNLNKILLNNKDYLSSSSFLLDIANYLFFYELNPRYGSGGEEYFDNLSPTHNLSSFAESFINEYFLCTWENPLVERSIINDKKLHPMLISKNIKDKFLCALRDYWVITKSFLKKKPDYSMFLHFFEKYDFYLFDPYRLLLLKRLHGVFQNEHDKEMVLDIINSKLNFKFPHLLADRIVNSQ